MEKIEFPVIVKPVDSSGSRGISVCRNKEELKRAGLKALRYSASKRLIIEQYIEGDEITVNYIIENGTAMLTSIHDRYFNTEQEGDDKNARMSTFIHPNTPLYILNK